MSISDESFALANYWKGRVESFSDSLHELEIEFFGEVYAQLKPKSVIVFGCGTGREFGYTEGVEWYGVDFTRRYVLEAHHRNPNANLVVCALQNMPFRCGTVFDLGLTATVLQHVSHEDIRLVVKNIKSMCKAVALEEGLKVDEEVFIQFNHNYEALFKPFRLKMQRPLGLNPSTHFFLFARSAQ